MPLPPAAVGIIFNHDRTKVLLTKRRDVPFWVLPGGGIEEGESPEEAVIREIWEEAGMVVQIERKCAEYIPINRLASFTTVFVCGTQIQEGDVTLPSENSETAAIGFFSVKNPPPLFFEIHHDWLNDVLDYSPLLVRKSLTQVTYFKLLKYFCRYPWYALKYVYSRFSKNNYC